MADVKRNGSIINTLKQHALTAISYLIPIVVGGGFLLAIGSLMGGVAIEDFNSKWGFADTLYTMGNQILGMLPVVIGTGIAFSIADKPGIAAGFLVGLISIKMNAGFIGGFVGGYIAGYIALFLRVSSPILCEFYAISHRVHSSLTQEFLLKYSKCYILNYIS